MKTLKPDVCIIGAGSGGLTVAAGAAQMGASVVLIEKDKMGGDCLNTGCVPSKALIYAGRVANTCRDSDKFGIKSTEPDIDFNKVHDHVHDVIAQIAPNDSIERFEKLGVKVINATGAFNDNKTVIAGDYKIKARRFVIATGSRARIPNLSGLEKVNYLTNETIFNLTKKPTHLIIVGGGPIGCEMAQAHLFLGCKVTLLSRHSILPKDEPELVQVARDELTNSGLNLFENINVISAKETKHGVTITIEENRIEQHIEGSHVLIAAGRQVNTDELALNKANIVNTPTGITTNNRLRSISNRRVYAIGDVAGSYQFTHVAGFHAGIVLQNILFSIPAKVNYRAIVWSTYIDPELAHVGLLEADAINKKLNYKTLYWSLKGNDRAITERRVKGKLKVIVDHKGKILGCSIIAPHAGELILPWCLAIENNMKIGKIAKLMAPYPTLSEASKRVSGSYFSSFLFSNKVKRVVRILQRILP